MTSTVDFSLFTSLFSHSTFFGLSWFVALLITMISLPMITKDPEKWKVLFLPVSLCWLIAGVNVHVIMLIIATLIFVQESIGLQTIGNVAKSAGEMGSLAYQGLRTARHVATGRWQEQRTARKVEAMMLGKGQSKTLLGKMRSPLATQGGFIDMDTIRGNITRQLRYASKDEQRALASQAQMLDRRKLLTQEGKELIAKIAGTGYTENKLANWRPSYGGKPGRFAPSGLQDWIPEFKGEAPKRFDFIHKPSFGSNWDIKHTVAEYIRKPKLKMKKLRMKYNPNKFTWEYNTR